MSILWCGYLLPANVARTKDIIERMNIVYISSYLLLHSSLQNSGNAVAKRTFSAPCQIIVRRKRDFSKKGWPFLPSRRVAKERDLP